MALVFLAYPWRPDRSCKTLAISFASLGLPSGDAYDLPTSPKRFPDGAQYRVEIPSVEGPRALAAVLEEAERQKVPIHRVSQGSGIMLLTDAEIREMAKLGRDAGIEVSLFVGPRAAWETSAQAVAARARTWARGCAAWTRWSTPSRTSAGRAGWASARCWWPMRACCGWSTR